MDFITVLILILGVVIGIISIGLIIYLPIGLHKPFEQTENKGISKDITFKSYDLLSKVIDSD